MKKTLLAAAMPALLMANAASAVELYNDNKNTFAVGGHVSVGLGDSEQGDLGVESVSPRLNVKATRDIGNGFVIDAKAEWGMNLLDGGESTFYTRLGYIGATHETFGRLVAGTQWAPYYDVTGVADLPIAFANDFLYEDQGNLGTARADKQLSYRKGFDLGNAGSLDFGLGWQGRQKDNGTDNYGARAQFSASYGISDFTVGYAYNMGNVDYGITGNAVDATSNAVALSYGNYGSGIYAAVVYTMDENLKTSSAGELEKSNGYEAIVAYAFANSLNLSLNYESVVDQTSGANKGDAVYAESAIQAEYNFSKDVMGYAGYQFDLGGDGAYDGEQDNKWSVGTRVFF